MARTITYTEKAGNYVFTISELNTLFQSIKTVLDGKVDLRGSVMQADLKLVDGSIINVQPATATGDVIPYGEQQ